MFFIFIFVIQFFIELIQIISCIYVFKHKRSEDQNTNNYRNQQICFRNSSNSKISQNKI